MMRESGALNKKRLVEEHGWPASEPCVRSPCHMHRFISDRHFTQYLKPPLQTLAVDLDVNLGARTLRARTHTQNTFAPSDSNEIFFLYTRNAWHNYTHIFSGGIPAVFLVFFFELQSCRRILLVLSALCDLISRHSSTALLLQFSPTTLILCITPQVLHLIAPLKLEAP